MKNKVLNEFKEWLNVQENITTEYDKIAGAYIRVSTDKQTELSPVSQLKEIWKYCQNNKIKLNLEYIYIEEEGISGKNAKKRDEFQRMISDVKSDNKPFDILVLWKFSRFARNQEESIVYKSILKRKHNINVISVSEPLPEGIFGGLIERIIEWFDEYYIINLSGEVKRGMTENALKGKYQATAPFGYKWDNKQLIVVEEEANIIKFIYSKFINNQMNMIELARYINELGFRTKRGGLFENRTISYILLNPVYKGYVRWNPDGKIKREDLYEPKNAIIKKGTHAPIIDEDTWEQAKNKLLLGRTFTHPHEQKTNDPWHWIKGLIRCGNCGKTFIRTNNKLRCNGYNKGTCTCGDMLKYEEVSDLILNQLKLDSISKTKIKITKQKKSLETDEKEIIKNQLQQLDKKEERIKNAYLNEIDTIEEYKENKKQLQIERNLLLEKLNKLNSETTENDTIKKIKENLKNAYEILIDDNISIQRKYEIIHFIIEKVEYKNNELTLFYNEFKDLFNI